MKSREIGKASASEPSDNVVDSNKTVISNCNNAPEMLQTKEIGQEGMTVSRMPESVQATINELPRKNETNEDVAPAAHAQPSRRPHRRSSKGVCINSEAAEETIPRRSSRAKGQHDGNPRHEGTKATHSLLGKRPLYLQNKRDEYEWYFPDYDDDEDDDDWM